MQVAAVREKDAKKEMAAIDVLTADAAAAQQESWNSYLKSKDIDKVFVEIVKSLIAEQPEDPIAHMMTYLSSNYPESAKKAGTGGGGGSAPAPPDDDDDAYPESEDDEEDYLDDDVIEMKVKNYNPGKKRGTISSESVKVDAGFVPPVYPKTPEDATFLTVELKKLFFMSGLSRKEMSIMVSAFRKIEFKAGEVIIQEGDKVGDMFYVLATGTCDITKVVDDKETKLMEIPNDQGRLYFGELAMLYDAPRKATVKAATDVALWGIDRMTFKSILMDTGNKAKLLYGKFIKEVPILSCLDESQKQLLLDVIKPMDFNKGDTIVKEGDFGDAFYIIEEGEAVCTKTIDGASKVVSDPLGPGKYFGELALIKNAPRAATVTASCDTSCIMIARDDFKRTMGPLSDMLKSNDEIYAKYVLDVTL